MPGTGERRWQAVQCGPRRDVQAARYCTGLSEPGGCCAAMSTPAGNCAGMTAPVGGGARLSTRGCAGVSKCRYKRTAQPGTAPPPPLKTAPDSTAPSGSAQDRGVTPRSAPDRVRTGMSAPAGLVQACPLRTVRPRAAQALPTPMRKSIRKSSREERKTVRPSQQRCSGHVVTARVDRSGQHRCCAVQVGTARSGSVRAVPCSAGLCCRGRTTNLRRGVWRLKGGGRKSERRFSLDAPPGAVCTEQCCPGRAGPVP